MDCERFDKLSLDLLYGELDELTTASARRHLHHCTRCQNIWSKLRATQEVAVVPLEDPPSDLFDSILALEREAQKRLSFGERVGRSVSVLADYAMRPQLAMAALLFLMLGSGLLLWRSNPTSLEQIVAVEDGSPTLEPAAPIAEARRAEAHDLSALGADERSGALAKASSGDASASGEAKPTVNPSEGYQQAMKVYQEGRYAEAERLFSEVASSESPKAASAALFEAHSARNGSGCQRAVSLYDEVAARFGGSTVSDEASYQAALCYRALGRKERAIAEYESLRNKPAFQARADAALVELRPMVASKVAADSAPESEAKAESASAASIAAAPATAAAAPAAKAKAAAKPASAAEPIKE